ncbi:hypothetical protein K488DRAFT_91504 [Vararia minispora EC-137]|uniref:Uncharacterized protein n=1 Tax=Vararia minispora EC-137 TaxID=1314806 RepID=A0ACB8Q5N1_9AGAM|nr:hypothetical protein K488DRAFT_91504 [Vararia minispora EC-137]
MNVGMLASLSAPAISTTAWACGKIFSASDTSRRKERKTRVLASTSAVYAGPSRRRRRRYARTSQPERELEYSFIPIELLGDLDVTLAPQHLAFDHTAQDVIVANVCRLRSLKLEGAPGAIVSFLERLESAPKLTVLEVTATMDETWLVHWRMHTDKLNDYSVPIFPSNAFCRFIPNLRRLVLSGMTSFPWEVLPPTLETLIVRGRAADVKYGRPQMSIKCADQLFIQLSSLPALLELELDNCLPPLPYTTAARGIHLIHLVKLVLSAPISAAAQLLSQTLLSSKTMVLLDLHCLSNGGVAGGDLDLHHIPRVLEGLHPVLTATGNHALQSVKLEVSGRGDDVSGRFCTLTSQCLIADQRIGLSLRLLLNGPAVDMHTYLLRVGAALTAGPCVRLLSLSDTSAQDWSAMFGNATNVRFIHASSAAATSLVGALQDPALFPALYSLVIFEADFTQHIKVNPGGGVDDGYELDSTTQCASEVFTRVLVERESLRELVLRDCGVPSVLTDKWQDLIKRKQLRRCSN